jgi:homoserine kinase
MSRVISIDMALSLYDRMSSIKKKEGKAQYPYTSKGKDITKTLNEIELVYSSTNKFYENKNKKRGGGVTKITVFTM